MMRQKFFTCVSLFGISLTIMICSVSTGLFNLAFGNSYPVVNRSRTYYLDRISVTDASQTNFSYFDQNQDFYRELAKSKYIQDICVYKTDQMRVFRKDKIVSFKIAYTDAKLWNIYNYEFIAGRPYTNSDVIYGKAYAVITESVKRFYFGEANAIGKTIGESPKLTVIGVVKDAVILVPNGPEFSGILAPYNPMITGYYSSNGAVILARSDADLDAIKPTIEQIVKKSEWFKKSAMKGFYTYGKVVKEDRDFKSILMSVSIFLFFIIIIPALNLIGLNVNRIAERSSEIGIRKAFGASSSVLAGQFIIENLIITIVGGSLGILLTVLISDSFIKLIFFETPESVDAIKNVLINWTTMFYAIAAILFFGLLSGIIPAWRMSRLHPVEALRGGRKS